MHPSISRVRRDFKLPMAAGSAASAVHADRSRISRRCRQLIPSGRVSKDHKVSQDESL